MKAKRRYMIYDREFLSVVLLTVGLVFYGMVVGIGLSKLFIVMRSLNLAAASILCGVLTIASIVAGAVIMVNGFRRVDAKYSKRETK